jgi:hypothetical protein
MTKPSIATGLRIVSESSPRPPKCSVTFAYDDPSDAITVKIPKAQILTDSRDGVNTNYVPGSWSNAAADFGYCYTGGCPSNIFPSTFKTFADAPVDVQGKTGRANQPLSPSSWTQ